MESHAGMNGTITYIRSQCRDCNRNAPSQQSLLPSAPHSPTTPFEQVFADYFDFAGHHYLLLGDRLSGWVEIFRAPHGTAYSGASGFVAALRSAFSTFGVPEEISSDGGPEFLATTTDKFFKMWNIHHGLSSAYFPKSNGRAEVAVMKCKWLLMDNVGPTGSLDKLLCALLQVRNTPDPDCEISPAKIVFGRQLCDAFTFLNRTSKFTNSHVRPAWRDAWKKEDALQMRFTRSCESLRHGTHDLPVLSAGDHVIVQNQQARHPTKSVIVVEVRRNGQNVVKIDGTSRPLEAATNTFHWWW